MIKTSPTVIIPQFRPKEDRGWWETIERNIRLGIGRKKVLQEQEAKDIARAERETQRKTVDGLGQLNMVIPLSTYIWWDQAQPGCWSDQQFKREFYRDNDAVRAAKPQRKYY